MVNQNMQVKYKLTLLATFASFAIIIAGFYFMQGITSKIWESRKIIAETQRDIDLIDKITKDKSTYNKNISEIVNTLPSDYYEISFFSKNLETLAQNNSLILKTDIDQKRKVEKENYDSIIYSLELQGSYSSVSNFLMQMASLPYHTSVDNIKMINDNGLLTDLKIRLFIQKI